MSTERDLDPVFLKAMRYKLDEGRKSYVGWDRHWENTRFDSRPHGSTGSFMQRLQGEVLELCLAIENGSPEDIRNEAADVANFAMFIADIHGALSEK